MQFMSRLGSLEVDQVGQRQFRQVRGRLGNLGVDQMGQKYI